MCAVGLLLPPSRPSAIRDHVSRPLPFLAINRELSASVRRQRERPRLRATGGFRSLPTSPTSAG